MVPHSVFPAGHLHFLPRLVEACVRHSANDEAIGQIEGLVDHEGPLFRRVRTTRGHNKSASDHAHIRTRSHLDPPFTSDNLLASRITASSDSRAHRRAVVTRA